MVLIAKRYIACIVGLILLCTPRIEAQFLPSFLFPSFYSITLTALVTIRSFLQRIFGTHSSGIGTCDGCFCITTEGESCPVERRPTTDFDSLIPILESFTWSNPYSLDCNPYNDDDCDTVPPLEAGGACIVTFTSESTTCPDNGSYSVSTYPGTFQEALANSSIYVTHEGACGACSSLQDLSVYMQSGSELKDKAWPCAILSRLNKQEGIDCYEEIGFTEGCATIWYYNSLKTAESCILDCLVFGFVGRPSNGPPPDCALDSCLECDETNSGPKFYTYAGRTRRNSGLLSNIVRPCSELVEMVHRNPCSI